MDKYQEAINELYKQRAERYKVHQKHKDWSKEIKEYDKVGEALETLQELVDQTKTPTLEEVKKEWEELGYEWKEDTEHFYLVKDVLSIISFKKCEKCYYANHRINRIVHKIITKTFKALGWL